jgi:hypothetical protein
MKRNPYLSNSDVTPLRRNRRPARLPFGKSFRLKLEQLEPRLAPANVNVTTFHYDSGITGENLQETTLTPANVNATNFGVLANKQVDGYTYAQPLYMGGLMIGGQPHNVAVVATEHDSVYAFDVVNDPNAPTGISLQTLWQRSFIDPTNGITTVPQPEVISGDIVPEIGITGAPVIDPTLTTNPLRPSDPASGTIYFVAKTKEVRADGNHYVQRLHALDITSGVDKYVGMSGTNTVTSGYTIGDTHGSATFANEMTTIVVPGAGEETSGGANPMVAFSAFKENQRPSLSLLNGRVIVGWASHGDNTPYHGWVVGFNETTLQPEKWFNTSPNAGAVGIWQSEGAISTDGTYLYFAVGNGFSGPNPAFDPAHGNYSESVIKLDPTTAGTMMTVADYFTPFDWQSLDNSDADLGSGGVMLLPNSVGSAAHPHLMVETGKSGKIYLIDRDNLGKFTQGGPDNVVQVVTAGPGGVWGNPAFYQESANSGLLIYHGSGVDTREFRISNGVISPANAVYNSGQTFGFPGAQPIISGNGTDNTTAIDWELQSDNYGQQGPEVLHAYGARPAAQTGTLTELYNSNQTGQRDKLAGSVKFTTSIEANGWVFAGQEYNFSVFGLFPTHATAPGAPTNLMGHGVSPTAIQLTWTSPNPNTATGIKIFRSAGDNQHYAQVSTVAAAATSYTDTGLMQGQVYFYKIAATNQAGDSAFTPEIQTSPLLSPPVLTVDNISSHAVSLVWTKPPAANDHYTVGRSTDGTNFTTITTTTQLSFVDTDPILVSQPGQYFYRVTAFTSSNLPAASNVVPAKVGPASQVIDYSGGFPLPPASPPDLQANGSSQFAETTARLTNAVNQAGSVFSVNEENILNWTTTFKNRLHEGTQPNYANGFAFVIQAVSPLVVGQGGQGIGYQGIPESVMIKFDTYTNGTENGTGGSTGLFFGGDKPDVPHQPGEVNLPLDATMTNLESQSTKTITLSYAYNPSNPSASILHEEIDDPDHPTTPFMHDYMVDIPSLIAPAANGNTIGFVGFTASTGSGGFWELQDVTAWKFAPTGPAAPHNLIVASSSNANDLSWKATSADEEGYYVERSTSQNTGFTRIATITAGTWTYHDPNLTNPQSYFYRVQAFNHSGATEQDSGYSNVATGAVVSVAFADFSNHTTLSANGNIHFPTTPPVVRLTDGGGGEASSTYYKTIVGTGAFSTTFVMRDQSGPTGSADGTTFVIQNDPRGLTALGAAGGALGYGGITNSVAIEFDLYTNGSHLSTTKLFTGGNTDKTGAIDMGPSGITLGNGDPLQVTLTYDGTALNETVLDTITGAIFFHSYSVNLATVIGGPSAYVGFTGGTGGETATQDILSWSGRFSQAPAQLNSYVVSAPATSTAGNPFQVTVTAMDQNGNVFTSYNGTVHFSSNDGQAMLPADYQFTAGDNGAHTFTVTLKTAGNETVNVNDSVKTGITGTATVAVSPASISALAVFGFPGIIRPGTPGTFTVKATDAYGNTVPSYTGKIHFTSTDSMAMLPADYQFVAGDNGTHNFTATLNTLGTQSITATDTMNGSIKGMQSNILVQLSGTVVVDFSTGFANHGNITTNGNATFPATPPVLRLTDGGAGEASTAWYNSVVGPGGFTTTFTLQDLPVNGSADGVTFIIQNDPRGTAARGVGGGGEGYAGILNSIAIKFDLYTHGSHNPSTGLFTGGQSPDSDPTKDVPLTGINLGSHDPIQVTLAYDGGTTITETVKDTVTNMMFSHSYTGVNLGQLLGGTTAFVGFGGGTGGETATQDIVSWTGSFQQGGGLAVTFANFANHGTVTANTLSNAPQVNVFPTTPPVMRLTDGRVGEATSTFVTTPSGTGPFTTTFTLHDVPVNGAADGVSFVMQDDPRGTAALGGGGGGEGYAGIVNSIAIKFDLYAHGTHNPLTGLFTGGQAPDSDMTKDVPLTGINLGSGDPIQVTLSYDGANLTETVVDTVTHAMFSHTYMGLNLPQVIGGNAAYVGFTAGTGGETATQEIQNWTGSFAPPQAAALRVSSPVNASAGTPIQVTVTALDQNNIPLSNYLGTVHFTSSDSLASLPANYTFRLADNGVHTFAVILNSSGVQSITATDTATSSITGTQTGITVKTGAFLTLDYSSGLGDYSNLTRNGSAAFVGPNATPVGILAGHQDVSDANLSPVGTASFSSGSYTLTAAGSDIWGTADQFQYTYEPLVGNGQIVARVTSAVAPDFWTKAGVMIRSDLSPGSPNAFMLYTPNSSHQEPVQQWRDTQGGQSNDTGNHNGSLTIGVPIWLKLVRSGNTFTGFWAIDVNGAPGPWNELTAHDTVMPTTVYVGLALTAHTSTTGPSAAVTFDHVTVTGGSAPLAPAIARMTDGNTGEAGSFFTNNRVDISYFTTTFTLRDQLVGHGAADSLSFVVQNDPRGPAALGGGGGAGGYSGITNSFAVKFDLYSHGSHNPTTGLFTGGQAPSDDSSKDVALVGIDLGSGHPLQITLTYNGTTLTETVVDTVNGNTFTHDWLVNLTQIIGSAVGYAGFTAGTGGETAIQDILSWTGTFPTPAPAAAYVTSTSELVTNGGFEAGDFGGWTLSGDTSNGGTNLFTHAADGVTVHSGIHAGQFGPDNLVFLTQNLTTNPGSTYTLSFWLSNQANMPGTEWLVRVGGNTLMDVTDAPMFNYTHYTFTFTATGSSTPLQFGFRNSPDWFYLDDVSVTTSPVAGAAVPLVVTALDVGGHRIAYTGTVHFTSTDPHAVLPPDYTFTPADNGQHVFTVTLTTAGNQVVTITDTKNSQQTTDARITVIPAAASTLVVSGFPSPTTAGVPGGVLVTALDPYGNVATGYRGTVHLTSSDGQAVLEADHTFTPGDNGVYSFAATLKTVGTQSITATDTATSTITGTQSGIVVNPAAASTFAVTASPTTITAGDFVTITVTAYDPYGNVATGYSGMVHFTSSDPQANLPVDSTLTNGTGTFTAKLYTAGVQTITATDTVNSSITGTATVTVNPAAATSLAVFGFPSPAQRMVFYDFTVEALDPYGNVATGYLGMITFSSDEDHASLPDDYTFTAADMGVHVFSAAFNRFGTFYLRATDVANPSITGEQDGIEVPNGPAPNPGLQPTAGTAGLPMATSSTPLMAPPATSGATTVVTADPATGADASTGSLAVGGEVQGVIGSWTSQAVDALFMDFEGTVFNQRNVDDSMLLGVG